MGKAIIITTPRPTQELKGQAIVASTDQNDTYTKAFPGATIEFTAGSGEIGDVVDCNITSAITCEIIKVDRPSILAEGKVTLTNIDSEGRCELEVNVICDPNPFGVKLDDKLQFKAPGMGINKDDIVACIPIALGVGKFVKVI